MWVVTIKARKIISTTSWSEKKLGGHGQQQNQGSTKTFSEGLAKVLASQGKLKAGKLATCMKKKVVQFDFPP